MEASGPKSGEYARGGVEEGGGGCGVKSGACCGGGGGCLSHEECERRGVVEGKGKW